MKPINLFEYESLASQYLSQMALDYYASGAWNEVTLRDNRAAYEQFKLRPRMLMDVSQRDLSTHVLGQSLQIPILIAPMAFHCLAHPEGELATVRAASEVGMAMVLSTLSTKSLEDVALTSKQWQQQPENSSIQNPDPPSPPCQGGSTSKSGGQGGSIRKSEGQGGEIQNRLWFQLYVHRDRALTRSLVERAEAAGYSALCVTVDTPLLGRRERDLRNHFTLPPGLELANLATLSDLEIPAIEGESGLFAYFAEQLDPGLTWRDVEWVQSLTALPVLVKGILRGDDAVRAVEHGTKGIIVSNHGGRQLDGAIASLEALPEVVEAVGDRAEVLVDGGIRRGTDVLKALALGAKAVLVGRPVLWGLAVDGEAGVRHVLELLRDEFDIAMALSGCAKVLDIDSSLVRRF